MRHSATAVAAVAGVVAAIAAAAVAPASSDHRLQVLLCCIVSCQMEMLDSIGGQTKQRGTDDATTGDRK